MSALTYTLDQPFFVGRGPGGVAVRKPYPAVCCPFPAASRATPAYSAPHVAAHTARSIADGRPLVARAGNRSPGYQRAKRALDIVGALVLLVLSAPVMLVTLVVLSVTTRGRPLFRQRRLGLCGRPMTIVKFSTMVPDAEQRQHAVRNEKDGPIFKSRRDPRVTRIGRILRKTSIDELPQLFNVLLGQMSLVGPRPPIPAEVAQYELWQRGRLAVKPGLTCLWQVSGRSEIGFQDWVRMDLWYVRNQNLWTDVQLLYRTPLVVLTGRGAY